jgi:integrase
MSCFVRTNRHGNLCLRPFWQGDEWQERVNKRGKPVKDTPANRERAELRAKIISEEMEAGTFDYLRWFPNGNRAAEFRPKGETQTNVKNLTVGEYYRDWIDRRKPPFVRPGLHHDYIRQFRRYILPNFETKPLVEIDLMALDVFRASLNQVGGLSLKSCRNIIDGTFRAMMRDARAENPKLELTDHFANLKWKRLPTSKPDPFTTEERDVVLKHFRQKHAFYYPFVATLFGTGARQSEIIALRWGDIDLKSGTLSISKSHYMGEDGQTKTAASERVIALGTPVIEALRAIKPLHLTEVDFLFKNSEGRPINEDKWRKKYWYRALRACNVRPRKFYATRHTFISVGLSNGVNPKWLAEYCGTSVAMIEKHYGRYIKSDSREQLERLFGAKPGTLYGTLREGTDDQPRENFEAVDNEDEIEVEKWSGRVDLNHRLHGPEPCALPS